EMTEYFSKALKQASTRLRCYYTRLIGPFLEDLTNLADRVFRFEECPRESPRLTAKTWQKMKDQMMLGAFPRFGSRLNGRDIHCDIIFVI
ncbi:MAG: hypothetical protein LUQ47_05420, partial [Methanotrichaceae archaeon]|nr:hypothetical protein [Methanotrichaceae archaeon]